MPYNFEGAALEVSSEPRIEDGITWVPLRSLAQALGASADWDPDNRVAILYIGDRITTFTIGDPTVDVDGEKTELRGAPYLDEGETWIPARFFQESLGYGLQVDQDSNAVTFSNPV